MPYMLDELDLSPQFSDTLVCQKLKIKPFKKYLRLSALDDPFPAEIAPSTTAGGGSVDTVPLLGYSSTE